MEGAKSHMWGKNNTIKMLITPHFNHVSMMTLITIGNEVWKQHNGLIKAVRTGERKLPNMAANQTWSHFMTTHGYSCIVHNVGCAFSFLVMFLNFFLCSSYISMKMKLE